jgi:hypothetical protein
MNINNDNKNMQRDNGTEIKKMYAENNITAGRDEIVKVQKNDVHANDDVTRPEDISPLGLQTTSTKSLKTAIDTKKKKRKRKSPLVPWKKPPGTFILCRTEVVY